MEVSPTDINHIDSYYINKCEVLSFPALTSSGHRYDNNICHIKSEEFFPCGLQISREFLSLKELHDY